MPPPLGLPGAWLIAALAHWPLTLLACLGLAGAGYALRRRWVGQGMLLLGGMGALVMGLTGFDVGL